MKITLYDWPSTFQEFEKLPLLDLTNPHNTASLFLIALDLFIQNQQEGINAINTLKGPIELNPHNISFLKDRLMDKPYLPKAYFEGATPENDYTPNKPYTLNLFQDNRPQDLEEGYMRLFVETKGADAKRFITLRKKGNHWYIWEYPGILMDIRKPKADNPWL